MQPGLRSWRNPLRRHARSLVTWTVLALSFGVNVRADDFVFMTHVIKPLSWQDPDHQYHGLAYELSALTMKRLGYSADAIENYPFARALRLVETTDDKVLFPVARIPERENVLKWVGPLFSNGVYFYQRKNASRIRSLEDLKKLHSIGVGNQNATMALLLKKGFDNLYPVGTEIQAVKMLELDRVDAIAVGEVVMLAAERSGEYGLGAFQKTSVKLYDSDLYIAFSKNVSDDEIRRWKKQLDEVKRDWYPALYDRYIK